MHAPGHKGCTCSNERPPLLTREKTTAAAVCKNIRGQEASRRRLLTFFRRRATKRAAHRLSEMCFRNNAKMRIDKIFLNETN